jgi:hypothetical protein
MWSMRGKMLGVLAAVLLAAATMAVAASTLQARNSRTPQFRVTLYGKNRTPRAGARWWYVVRAVSTNGRRFSGTAIMRVVLRGKVIDTIGWFGFKGYLRRTYRFNRLLRGRRVVLQARVVGTGGVRTVGYLVRVR